MVISIGPPFDRSTMALKDNKFKPNDFKWSERPARLQHRFLVLRKLGQGTYGKVQLALNKETNQEVAIKTIKKARIESEEDMLRIRREIHIMTSIRHPHIIHINEVFETRQKIVLVMQYASGGELYDYLGCHHTLPEKEARRIFRQIASAIYYCHKNKICHRDLKLENILLDEEGNAQIADFGLSNIFDERRRMNTFCGSPLYASPEIVKGTPYKGPEVDCWSLGVLLYTLIYGTMPFDGRNFKELVSQISEGRYEEPINKSSASGLIRRLLTPEIPSRATISDVCKDSWVNQEYNESLLKIAETMALESLLKTRKLGSAKISSEQSIKNGSMKTVFQTTKLGLDQRNEENNSVTNHCGIINDDSENLSSVNGHGSQKAYLYEQILNYDVSFVINKLLVAVESALACPMMEINTKTLVTTVKEKSLSAFKPWPRNGENNLATKVESAYVIPIFEVTSVMPRMTSKNAIIQNNKKGPQICFTANSIQNETMLQTSELDSNTVIKNKLKTKNIESSIQNQPKKSSLTIGDSKESLRQNGVEFSKQGADLGNQNAVSTEVEAPKSSTDSAENDEPKDISQVKNLMLQENILSRIPSVKIKRAHDNHLFGQKHFGPFFRSKNHSLSLARIFSMKYEKLVLNTFKVPDRKQKPPGKITIPATFDPATSPNHVQERKEIILFPSVSVSENKQKIEKKIDKIKKAALNMNLIRRSNSKNRLRIQKYLKSQAKKIQDLVCDEQRSLAGSMEHINGSDGFPTVSESYFGRFEKGNLNSLNIKLHNKKINFIYSSTNNSNNPFAFDFFSGAKGKSTDSENSLMEQRENFGIAKSKSDIHFPINYTTCNSSNEGYRSSNGLGYNRSSNILNVTNGDCLLVRSASDSEGLNFLKHMSNIYGCEEKFIFPELNTPYLHVDEQSNHNESLFYHDSENLNNLHLTGKANHQVGLRSDLCLSEDTHIAKSCQNESKSIKSTNCKNKGNFTVHRSISTNNCTGFQNFTANDLQNIKRLLLTPLSENVKYKDKIGIESNNNSKQKLNMMNNAKSFLWGANTVTEDECGTTNVKQKFLRRRNSFSGVPVCNDHPIHSYLENTRGKSVDSGMGIDDYFWIPDNKQELLLVHQNETTSFSSSPNLGHLSLGKEINYKMVNDSRGIDNLNIQTKVGNMDFYETSPNLLSSAHNSIGKSALLRRILQASDNDGTYCDFSKNGANRAKSISEDVLAHLENDDVLRKTQSERKLSLPQSIIGRQNNQRKSPFLSKFLNDLENREQFPNAAGSSLNQRRHLRNPPTFGKRPKLEKKSKSFLQLLSLKRIQEAEKELEKTERNHRIEAEEEENSGSLLEALKTHGYKGVISQRFQGAENDSLDPYNLKGCVSSYLSRKISPDISLFNPMHYGTFPHFSTSMYEDNDSDIFNGISMRSLYEMYPSHRQNSPKQFVYDWLTTSHNGDYPTPFKIDQDSLLDSEKSNHTQEPESPLHWGKESAKSFDEEVSSSESFETPKEQYTNGTLNNESNRTRDNLTEYADLPNHARSDRNPLLRTSSASEDEKEESVQDRIWRKSFYSRFNNSALSRKERSSFLESPQLSSESRASFRENCSSPFKVTLRDGTDYVKLNGNNKDPQSKRIHTAKKYSSTNDVTAGCAKTKPSKSTKHFPLERTETATTLTAEMDEPEH